MKASSSWHEGEDAETSSIRVRASILSCCFSVIAALAVVYNNAAYHFCRDVIISMAALLISAMAEERDITAAAG